MSQHHIKFRDTIININTDLESDEVISVDDPKFHTNYSMYDLAMETLTSTLAYHALGGINITEAKYLNGIYNMLDDIYRYTYYNNNGVKNRMRRFERFAEDVSDKVIGQLPDELIKKVAADIQERQEWLGSLKANATVVIRTSGQGFFDIFSKVIDIKNGIIEVDDENDPAFDAITGEAIEERQKYSFPAWLEKPGGLFSRWRI